MSLYGLHRDDAAWTQSERPDEPDTNELVDSPPDETDQLHRYVEDLLSAPEPEEGNPYHGTDNSDPDFYSDEAY